MVNSPIQLSSLLGVPREVITLSPDDVIRKDFQLLGLSAPTITVAELLTQLQRVCKTTGSPNNYPEELPGIFLKAGISVEVSQPETGLTQTGKLKLSVDFYPDVPEVVQMLIDDQSDFSPKTLTTNEWLDVLKDKFQRCFNNSMDNLLIPGYKVEVLQPKEVWRKGLLRFNLKFESNDMATDEFQDGLVDRSDPSLDEIRRAGQAM